MFRAPSVSPGTAAPVSAQGLQPGLSAGPPAAAILRRGVSPGGEEVAPMESAAEVPRKRAGKGKA